jgi:hypothetical protein
MPYTFVDSTNFSFFSEGGGSRFLWNVGNYPPNCSALQTVFSI